jgi:hypothetical protein
MAETFFCVACILVEVVWSYQLLFTAVFLSINYLSASLALTITVTPDMYLSNPYFPSMAYESRIHRPARPEKSQKIQKISKGKSQGLEPRTSGLAVGILSHCTIRLVR